jgi:hypothetical protein
LAEVVVEEVAKEAVVEVKLLAKVVVEEEPISQARDTFESNPNGYFSGLHSGDKGTK